MTDELDKIAERINAASRAVEVNGRNFVIDVALQDARRMVSTLRRLSGVMTAETERMRAATAVLTAALAEREGGAR